MAPCPPNQLRPVLLQRVSQLCRSARSKASARFSSNTICFNGQRLCVVNPNYLNSVREDNPAATSKRDLVKVHFGRDGRIDASCYDDGCEVIQK